MRVLIQFMRTGSRTLSYMLGSLVILLVSVNLLSRHTVSEIARWVPQVFGITFILLLGGLIFCTLFCWVRLNHPGMRESAKKFWLEAGLQAANGITTLALTYTLLGISLGIGTLAGQPLTPETVQPIIRSLTENFSLAFLTTVVGLPTAAMLRALLLISHARHEHSINTR